MEVIDSDEGMLSNMETYQLLSEVKNKNPSQKGKSNEQLATVIYETMKYLETTPCKYETEESMTALMQALNSYRLTKAEKLQLLNHRPTEIVELQIIIEENEERLTEFEMTNLLECIEKTSPKDPNAEQSDENQMEDIDEDKA